MVWGLPPEAVQAANQVSNYSANATNDPYMNAQMEAANLAMTAYVNDRAAAAAAEEMAARQKAIYNQGLIELARQETYTDEYGINWETPEEAAARKAAFQTNFNNAIFAANEAKMPTYDVGVENLNEGALPKPPVTASEQFSSYPYTGKFQNPGTFDFKSSKSLATRDIGVLTAVAPLAAKAGFLSVFQERAIQRAQDEQEKKGNLAEMISTAAIPLMFVPYVGPVLSTGATLAANQAVK